MRGRGLGWAAGGGREGGHRIMFVMPANGRIDPSPACEYYYKRPCRLNDA